MSISFETKELPHIISKTNGRIKKAVGYYRDHQIPLRFLLQDYLAVLSYGDELEQAINPWQYYYKGILKYEIESGVSSHETAFTFGAMTLKDEMPTDVIRSAFYSNQRRNDSDFEIGYLLPIFIQTISRDDNVLIVNPSPDMICYFEEYGRPCQTVMYAVSDETVAKLYTKQFPDSAFFPFDHLESIQNIDALLLVNRDQKISESEKLLSSLICCNENAKVLGLIPTAWFDSTKTGAYQILNNSDFSINQALLLDSSTTNSTPRKKMIVFMEKGENPAIEVKRSTFDKKNNVFTVSGKTALIDKKTYLESEKTIISCRDDAMSSRAGGSEPVYNKAEEYAFSKEISLFYKVYSDRKNKYAGVTYYKEIKSIEPKRWGRKLTPDIEKGLRADTREEVISAIENIVFDDKVYPCIRSDVEKHYIKQRPVTLKTVWFYCWSSIVDSPKYDHDFMCRFFKNKCAAGVIPQARSGEIILDALAESLDVPTEEIPFYRVDQLHFLLQTALKMKLILFNPLEGYMAEYSRRATERQQDVRNALVKKHFSDKEELSIILGIIGKHGSKKLLCSEKSLLLASAIRLFSGISIREVAALKWGDFVSIQGTNAYQFLITKFVDKDGNIMQHAEKQNWNRFRIIPSATVLTDLLLARKQYLIGLGIDEEYLSDCPIILKEERISDMKGLKRIPHCKPSVISDSSNELIKLANIPENTIVLPDEKNDLTTDFNRYHGDIFQTNFRDKANHSAFMTNGEINYVLGVDAPDTFSRHYCDYTNDFIQLGIIQKLCRWEIGYERMITNSRLPSPSCGAVSGEVRIEAGPYRNGVASVDLIIENQSDKKAEMIIQSLHGLELNTTVYRGNYGKNEDQ